MTKKTQNTSKISIQSILDSGEKVGPYEWMVVCPAHNDPTPSLSIRKKDGNHLLYCFAGCSFKEIIDAYGISGKDLREGETPFRQESEHVYYDKDSEPVKRKRKLRQVGSRTKLFGIDLWEENKWKTIKKGEDKKVPLLLYNLPQVIKTNKVLYTEGESCCDLLQENNIPATTLGSAGEWSEEAIEPLLGKRVYILPDNDKPGLEAAKKLADYLLGKSWVTIIELPGLPPKGDIVDYLTENSIDDLKRHLNSAYPYRPDGLMDSSAVAKLFIPEIISVGLGHKKIGFKTGYKDIDEHIGGFVPGNLIILAARPNMGKTLFAMNIIENNKDKETPDSIAVFSLEMNDQEFLIRFVAKETGINPKKIRNGALSEGEVRAIQEASYDYNCHIDSTPNLSYDEIEKRLRNMETPDLVIIDYLGIMDIPGSGEQRNNEIGKVTKKIKALSKRYHFATLLISQLSRAPEKREDPRPILSDLRDSGSIEQDADLVFFIHRDRDSKGHYKNQAELNLAKYRQGTQKLFHLDLDWKRLYYRSRGGE